MIRRFAVALTLFASLAVAGMALTDGPRDDKLLERSEKILKEARTQQEVGKKLADVSRNFRDLAEDMKANGLGNTDLARSIKKAAATLESVGNEHIARAQSELRLARDKLGNPSQSERHLMNAHDEIERAVQQLNTLVRLAESLKANEQTRALLKELIEDQKKNLEETRKLAKENELLKQEKMSEAKLQELADRQKKIADEQKKIADSAKELPRKIDDAKLSANPEQKDKLDDAKSILDKEKVESRMKAAESNLKDKDKIIAAANEQRQALDALKEIDKLLNPPNNDPLEIAKADKGDKGEKQPGDKGEKQPGDKGEKQPGDKGEKQPGDKGEKQPGDKGEKQPGDKGEKQPGDKGEKQPGDKGEKQPGDKGEKQPGDKGEKQPGDKGEKQPGDKGEKQPGDKGEKQPGDKGEMQPGDKGEKQPGDKGEKQPGDKGEKQPGDKGEKQPGDKGEKQPGDKGEKQPGDKGEKGEKGEKPGDKDGDAERGMSKPGKGEGQVEPKDGGQPQPMESEAKKGEQGQNDSKGDPIANNKAQGPDPKARLFSKNVPDGNFNRDSARWNPLADRERAPVMERYIEDLPLEYRDLLRQYYESLAK